MLVKKTNKGEKIMINTEETTIFFTFETTQSTQSAINKLVSRVPPLFRLELKMIFLPSGENIGKASKTVS